jgi:hypothetical protein
LSAHGSGSIPQNMRFSAGTTTKTSTIDSNSSEDVNEYSKIKRRFKKLDLNSQDDEMSIQTI